PTGAGGGGPATGRALYVPSSCFPSVTDRFPSASYTCIPWLSRDECASCGTVSKCFKRRVTSTNCRASLRRFGASSVATRPPPLGNDGQCRRRKVVKRARHLHDTHRMVQECTRRERAGHADSIPRMQSVEGRGGRVNDHQI